jgi:general stress protein 26
MDNPTLLKRVRRLLHYRGQRQGLGVFTTVGHDRRPHAAWMGSVATPSVDRVITLSSPESRKVQNILENPRVEWMFCDEEKKEVLYLEGRARVLEDPDEVERAWRQIPDKSHAYFLSYQPIGMAFLIIETTVDRLKYKIPEKNETHVLTREEFAEPARPRRPVKAQGAQGESRRQPIAPAPPGRAAMRGAGGRDL